VDVLAQWISGEQPLGELDGAVPGAAAVVGQDQGAQGRVVQLGEAGAVGEEVLRIAALDQSSLRTDVRSVASPNSGNA
jgi:hypothetical protein